MLSTNAWRTLPPEVLCYSGWVARALTRILNTHTRGKFKWREPVRRRRAWPCTDHAALQEVLRHLGAPLRHNRRSAWLDLRGLQEDEGLTVFLALLADEDAQHPRMGVPMPGMPDPIEDMLHALVKAREGG